MKYLLLFLFVFASVSNNFAQCSDSGICTLGGHSENQSGDIKNYSFGLNYSFSASGKPDNITYNHININGEFDIDNSTTGSVSLPYLFQSVEDGNSSSGLGDVMLSVNKKIHQGLGKFFVLQLGTKLPLSLIDKKNFTYLNGYGTLDLIPGITYRFREFSVGAAAQIPLTKYSDDQFEFSRGTDILLHLSYHFSISGWNMKVQNFNIKRINKSKLLLKDSGQTTGSEIPDSDFLQINFLFGAERIINENMVIDFSAAFPLLNRKENSDGTQRALSLSAGVKVRL